MHPRKNLDNNYRAEYESSIITEGPLKLFRNYSSTAIGKNLNKQTWRYELIGSDRGQKEHKQIDYFSQKLPRVNIFIDDKGAKSLKLNPNMIGNFIDPVSVLIDTIFRLRSNQEKNCKDEYKVFDGKRIYDVNALTIKNFIDNLPEKQIVHCRYEVLNNSQLGGSVHTKNIRNWPFNKNGSTVEVWFSEEHNFMPTKYLFNSPIGKITGLLQK